jgi:tetratricopeptide (TPR) repeat protein
VAAAEGDLPTAIAEYRRSLAANEAVGERRGMGIARYFLGCALDADGQPDEALVHLAAAGQLVGERHDDRMAARVTLAIGEAMAHLGRYSQAWDALREAVAVFAALGAQHYEVQGLQASATVAVRLGAPALARQYLTRALTLVDEADPRVPQLHADLAALPTADPGPPTDR